MFVKDTALLRLLRKTDSFPQRPTVVLAFLCVVVVIIGGIVVRSSTWSPAVLRPMSSSATVLARVDVRIACVARVGRAISFLVLVFAFARPLAFLERVDPRAVVIICAFSISS